MVKARKPYSQNPIKNLGACNSYMNVPFSGLNRSHVRKLGCAKILFSFWWLFIIVMTATFGANLVAFLTVSKTVIPFKSLSELADQDVYHFGTLYGTGFMDLLKVHVSVFDFNPTIAQMIDS